MSRALILLQPPTTIVSPTIQLSQFVARVGNYKTGVVYVDVFSTTAAITLTVSSCSSGDENNYAAQGTAGSNWITAGSSGSMGAAGSYKFNIVDLGDVIRWEATGSATANIVVRVFLSEF